MFSPIEQFDQIIKLPLLLQNFEISITNVTFSIFTVLFLIVYIFSIYLKDTKLIPLSGQIALEELYKFIINIIKDQMGIKYLQILPIVMCLFLLI
jgi:F-type H+-transporting ATPase subunit a